MYRKVILKLKLHFIKWGLSMPRNNSETTTYMSKVLSFFISDST